MYGIALRCKHCQKVIQSSRFQQFHWCDCKKIAIDGADEYFRALGEFADMEVVDETVPGVQPLTARNKKKFANTIAWLKRETQPV
jgi:hypothetical protein